MECWRDRAFPLNPGKEVQFWLSKSSVGRLSLAWLQGHTVPQAVILSVLRVKKQGGKGRESGEGKVKRRESEEKKERERGEEEGEEG